MGRRLGWLTGTLILLAVRFLNRCEQEALDAWNNRP